MSSSEWSFGRRALLLGIGALAACGYEPVNSPDGAAAGLKSGEIAVRAPVEEDEYTLVEALERRLGQAKRAGYMLDYTLKVDEVAVGITPNQETTRYNVIGRIDWTLTDLATGSVATSGGFESFSSYAATGSAVSSLTAQEDAHRRLTTLMADQIVTRLTATAADWRQ
ncbi:LPS assembly lipoprotein LptE [Frigidibacter sp. ROC022]|uniref:LPS assembly lipoprotein LptE n=1 Tax=Frigidibacter sp. ROC022 TaxID=2971796 RepID=UPI00215B3928|nr:LPS assembly lipoprotein LptE [Frigidibacter sp. ROC022]MCR8724944.1 LPS assembly lipoprotein LptE [Frigidibacter sp. ROC022]